MTVAALAGLAGLALADSTSFGTLVLPLMMLLAPQVRVRNVMIYLVTIAAFYFAVGVALLAGASAALAAVGPALDTTTAYVVQLGLGVVLFAVGFVVHPRAQARRRARRDLPPKEPAQWRERALGPAASVGVVMGVALLAGLIEVASMLPYLVAVGIIVAAGLPVSEQLVVLGAYVAVMVAPALVLLAGRRAAGPRMEPRLQRMERWISDHTANATAGVLGVIGVLLALDASRALLT